MARPGKSSQNISTTHDTKHWLAPNQVFPEYQLRLPSRSSRSVLLNPADASQALLSANGRRPCPS
eukprot:7965436-Alexandrium_andersonii.AAC.1